jgi:hypothetical protein
MKLRQVQAHIMTMHDTSHAHYMCLFIYVVETPGISSCNCRLRQFDGRAMWLYSVFAPAQGAGADSIAGRIWCMEASLALQLELQQVHVIPLVLA